jgi:hypothetical protein
MTKVREKKTERDERRIVKFRVGVRCERRHARGEQRVLKSYLCVQQGVKGVGVFGH